MGLKECIARDIQRVFLSQDDFCDELELQIGETKFVVVGSLQSNLVQNNADPGAPLQSSAWTLYIKWPLEGPLEPTLLSSGTRLTINGKSYSVVSVSNEMGLATVALSTHMGR